MISCQPIECPGAGILTSYVRGSLSDAEAIPIDQHLETCVTCLTQLESLATPDEFFQELNQAANQPPVELSPQWAELMREWSNLSLHSSSAVSEILSHTAAPSTQTPAQVSKLLSPTQHTDDLGQLGPYRVRSVLGRGGMGLVLRAYDPELDREVAVKVMLPQKPPQAALINRFEREARALASLRSEHVVQVFAVARAETPSGTVPYLAMELLHGETLADRLLLGALPIAELLDLALQLTVGLAAVHARGIVHRDIKPGNIWLEQPLATDCTPAEQLQYGRIKLLDFGLAHLESQQTDLTRIGTRMGTPGYMASEQIQGKTIGVQADLFSLGAVLYEMATGRVAFCGREPTAVMAAVLIGTFVDPATHNPKLPRRLTRLIRQLLANREEDRPASAKAVWTELKAIQSSLAVPPQAVQKNLAKARFALLAVIFLLVLFPLGTVVAWFISQRVQIETPHGTLIIESDDPAAAVQISRRGTVLIDRTTKRQLPLDVGEYGIRIVDQTSGLTLSSNHFVITRDGHPVITIQRIPPKPTNLKPTVSQEQNIPSLAQPPASWTWPANQPQPAISPFSADEAVRFQETWAKHFNVPLEWTDPLGNTFRLIPPGEFWMGSTEEEVRPLLEPFAETSHDWKAIHSQTPRHRVILTRPFYLSAHELTQQQYQQVMGKNPARFAPEGVDRQAVIGLDTSRFAVDGASWNDMLEFCDRLNASHGIVPLDVKQSNAPGMGRMRKGYRLPTEAEWEFACRAGTTTRFWSGDRDSDLAKVGWTALNAGGRVHEVGQLPANPFGLYDVHGNLWEFCMDAWSLNAFEEFRERPAIDPAGPLKGGERRVRKGGLWFDTPHSSRSAAREQYDDWTPVHNCGVRLAINIEDCRSLILQRKTSK